MCLHYTCTTRNRYWQCNSVLRSLKLIFFKRVENYFRCLHLDNLKPLPALSSWTTLAQPDFHYIHVCIQYNFQSLILAESWIFVFMLKWHILRGTLPPWFLLHLQNMISLACNSYCVCVWFLAFTYFELIFIFKLSHCLNEEELILAQQ